MAPTLAPPATGIRLSPLGPGGRPFAGLRPLAALLASGAILAGGLLLLSDRAPGLLERVSRRIDVGSRVAQLAAETRSQSDFEIHVVLWGAVTVLVGLAMWSNRSLLASAVTILVVSGVAERAQGVLTETRSMQVADLAGNVIGVCAGLGLVSGLAILMGWQDRPPPVRPPTVP